MADRTGYIPPASAALLLPQRYNPVYAGLPLLLANDWQHWDSPGCLPVRRPIKWLHSIGAALHSRHQIRWHPGGHCQRVMPLSIPWQVCHRTGSGRARGVAVRWPCLLIGAGWVIFLIASCTWNSNVQNTNSRGLFTWYKNKARIFIMNMRA